VQSIAGVLLTPTHLVGLDDACFDIPMSTEFPTPEVEDLRKSVGVVAARVTPALRRLLTALERVFPVRFEQTDSVDRERFAGAVVIDANRLDDVPNGIPRLVLASGARRHGHQVMVGLSDDSSLVRPLRKAILGETVAEECLLGLPDSGRVLASAGRRPVWWRTGEGSELLCVSAYPLAELGDGEALRDYLRTGCFMELLPLLHFLGLLLDGQTQTLPSLRASFIIDDPNLHWPTYGFLKYGDLVGHASKHGYHVALATVPLDGWLIDKRAASLVRENPSVLSLLMHGNDHVAFELGRLDERDAEPAIAQALRRIAALERRSGVTVDRVMAPPHGACSEPALRAMFRLGIEAACISRPYPWRDGLPAPTPLAGWLPAEMVAGGLPVLPRCALSLRREELVFRALLGQPLILYGHHQDFSHGLDLFAQAADEVNSLGDVRWGSLGWIARGNYTTRRVGKTLHVGMHARHISIEVPADVRALRVQVQEPFAGPAWRELVHTGGVTPMTFGGGWGESELGPIDGPTRLDLTLSGDRPLNPLEVAPPALRPWPLMRRAIVEGRDRLQPLLTAGSGRKSTKRRRSLTS
jgi:hypothetical protein